MKKINDFAAACMICEDIVKINAVYLNSGSDQSKVHSFVGLKSDNYKIGDRILVPAKTTCPDGILKASNAKVVDIQNRSNLDVYFEYEYKLVIGKLDYESYGAKLLALENICEKVQQRRSEIEKQSVLKLLGFDSDVKLELPKMEVEKS